MKKMNLILRKCKSLSRQLGRSSSYSSLRSKSTTRDNFHYHHEEAPPPLPVHEHQAHGEVGREIIFVGSTRKRYVINSKYLDHPLLKSLIEKPDDVMIVVKCEVVLFDHLLWMLDNADPDFISDSSLEELAGLYVC